MIEISEAHREAMNTSRIWPTDDGKVVMLYGDPALAMVMSLSAARACLLTNVADAEREEREGNDMALKITTRRAEAWRTAIMMAEARAAEIEAAKSA